MRWSPTTAGWTGRVGGSGVTREAGNWTWTSAHLFGMQVLWPFGHHRLIYNETFLSYIKERSLCFITAEWMGPVRNAFISQRPEERQARAESVASTLLQQLSCWGPSSLSDEAVRLWVCDKRAPYSSQQCGGTSIGQGRVRGYGTRRENWLLLIVREEKQFATRGMCCQDSYAAIACHLLVAVRLRGQ